MLYHHPKTLSVLIAFSVALFTVLLLWMFGQSDSKILISVFVAVVIAVTPATYFVFHRIIFLPLQKLQQRVREWSGPRFTKPAGKGNPLKLIEVELTKIIESKQEEIDRLKKLESLRKDFIADVSHELKTPIFAAQGFVHTLLDGAMNEKAVRNKFLKKAAKSLDGLDLLVQDLLTLSQIETGQIKMRFSHFDLYSLSEEVFEQFKSKVDKKGISLRIGGPNRKVIVYGDAARISQVLSNLISNAIKHSFEGSEVLVSFSVRKKSVVTTVKDSGEGIPAEDINRVFERFYRVDKSRSREKGGTGLGLAIVKHILEGHHTKAEVESEPGKGAAFRFRLPRAKKENNGTGEHDTSEHDAG